MGTASKRILVHRDGVRRDCRTVAATTAANAVTLKEVKDRGYIRIAVANEIPYGYVDPNGDAKGAGPDVAKEVVKALGIEPDNIQWVVTNFSSLIPGLQANRFDMTAAEMAIRPERCQKVVYSEPNTSYGEGLLVAAGDPKGIHTYADFAKAGMKVAVMAGADQLNMMQSLGVPEANIVTIAANADAISTVSTGRADAYAATGLTASELAGEERQGRARDGFRRPGRRRQGSAELGRLQLQQRLDGPARRLQRRAGEVQEDRRVEEDPVRLRLHARGHRRLDRQDHRGALLGLGSLTPNDMTGRLAGARSSMRSARRKGVLRRCIGLNTFGPSCRAPGSPSS